MSEDVNVEHLLNILTTNDPTSKSTWDACSYFIDHIFWHKQPLVMLGSKIEGLPDSHPSKPQCLFELSQLVDTVGNPTEGKQLLVHTSKLWRAQGDQSQVVQALLQLVDANRLYASVRATLA